MQTPRAGRAPLKFNTINFFSMIKFFLLRQKLARCAATLANSGVNPISQDEIFDAEDVK